MGTLACLLSAPRLMIMTYCHTGHKVLTIHCLVLLREENLEALGFNECLWFVAVLCSHCCCSCSIGTKNNHWPCWTQKLQNADLGENRRLDIAVCTCFIRVFLRTSITWLLKNFDSTNQSYAMTYFMFCMIVVSVARDVIGRLASCFSHARCDWSVSCFSHARCDWSVSCFSHARCDWSVGCFSHARRDWSVGCFSHARCDWTVSCFISLWDTDSLIVSAVVQWRVGLQWEKTGTRLPCSLLPLLACLWYAASPVMCLKHPPFPLHSPEKPQPGPKYPRQTKRQFFSQSNWAAFEHSFHSTIERIWSAIVIEPTTIVLYARDLIFDIFDIFNQFQEDQQGLVWVFCEKFEFSVEVPIAIFKCRISYDNQDFLRCFVLYKVVSFDSL